MSNLGRVVQDAPFGFIAIANNLDPLLQSFQQLQKTSGGTTGALKSLLGSLTGPGGIALALSAVTSAITFAQIGFDRWFGGLSKNKGVVRFVPIPGTDSSEMHIDYDGVKTDEDRQQYSKEFREGMIKAEKLYKKEKREAYKYLADHIDYWWD